MKLLKQTLLFLIIVLSNTILLLIKIVGFLFNLIIGFSGFLISVGGASNYNRGKLPPLHRPYNKEPYYDYYHWLEKKSIGND